MIVKVTIEEVLKRHVIIRDAKSIDEAINQVENKYQMGEVVFDEEGITGEPKITGESK